MTQVSKYPIRKDVEQRIDQLFQKAIAKLNDPKDIEDFLKDFLSPVEKIVFAKRLAIGMLLAKGYDYSSIREILKVTPPTIASVSVTLKYSGKGYKKILEMLISDEQKDAFWGTIGDIISSVPPKGGDNIYSLSTRFEKKQSKRRKAF